MVGLKWFLQCCRLFSPLFGINERLLEHTRNSLFHQDGLSMGSLSPHQQLPWCRLLFLQKSHSMESICTSSLPSLLCHCRERSCSLWGCLFAGGGVWFWIGTKPCSILPFSGPIHQEHSPAVTVGLGWGAESTQAAVGRGSNVSKWYSADHSHVPNITGSSPFHSSPKRWADFQRICN